ncbi:MAG: pitrilysin family protein [Nitrospirota bacterium]
MRPPTYAIIQQWFTRPLLAVAVALLLIAPAGRSSAAAIEPARWVTKSGIVVLFVERHSLPTVHLQLLVKAGSALDPAGREGTANLVASLLDEGTTGRSSQQIAEAIDFLGASLSAGAGPDATTVSLNVLKKDLDAGMAIFSDVVLNPSFPEDELQRVRQQILGGLIAEEDDPGTVARKAWQPLVYGAHPYRHPVEGTRDSLPAITRDELLAFHRQYYQPRQAILAVVGDLKRRDVETLLARHFGSWKNSGPLITTALPAPEPSEPATKLIDKDLTQATIIMGHLGLPRNHPDFYAVSVMNYVLGGGGFASRLMTEIRDNQGLVYGVHSAFQAMRAGGSFLISLQTKNATANQAMAEIKKVVAQVRTEGVTAQELEEAKAYLIGSFPLRLDTNAKLVGLLTNIELFELGLDYFDEYPGKIGAVTLEDVRRVAARYLHPDRMVLVVVAKQAEAQIVSQTSASDSGSKPGSLQ